MLKMYRPCDVCSAEPENDMTFNRWEAARGSWLQYSLCNKHLPRLDPRVHIWTHQWRIGHKLATFLRLGIGLGGCYRCTTPWDCVRNHTTTHRLGTGCFALCEKCWQGLTPEQRLPYYDQLINQWAATGYPESTDEIELIRMAVLEGK